MEAIAVSAARASRWAATLVCSLCFALPCAAGPFPADADGPPDLAVAATLLPDGEELTTDSAATLPTAPLLSDVSLSSVPGDAREEGVSGDALARPDSLGGMLGSLLDQGFLVPETERTYHALPGMSGTPPAAVSGTVLPAPAGDGSPEFTWRETGFNVMRWTSAALAVLAVVGIVIILVMPGLRRRLFFPEMPPMPPRPA